MEKNLTLEEIGRRAGVSRSTVSRVLNDHPDVRTSVREKVEAVIAETGYVPNQAARALVSNRTGLIGLVMLTEPDELFGDPYYSALVQGIQQGCRDNGLIFSIFPTLGEGGDTVLAGQISQGFVDGVIITAGPRSEAVIESLRARGTRFVVVGHPEQDEDLMRIDVDNHGGAHIAVDHLLGAGRNRVAYIGPTDDFVFGVERLEGFREALGAAGSEVDERLIQTAAPTREGGAAATTALLPDAPDAIFAATDTMALGVLDVLADRGLRVPEDVAVVGFDGLPGAPATEPRLTTVIQPVEAVGAAAVATLADDDIDAPHVVILPTSLQPGDSCGR